MARLWADSFPSTEVPIGAKALSIVAVGAAFIAPAAHQNTVATQCDGAASFRHFSSRTWAPKHWRRESLPSKVLAAKRKQLNRARGCGYRGKLRATWERDRLRFGRYREFRQVAPYPGLGTFWAIPAYIVACESGGSWTAYNPSGAAGPYQLLGWGAPYPATTWKAKMENHRIAAEVFAGGAGASNWVCA